MLQGQVVLWQGFQLGFVNIRGNRSIRPRQATAVTKISSNWSFESLATARGHLGVGFSDDGWVDWTIVHCCQCACHRGAPWPEINYGWPQVTTSGRATTVRLLFPKGCRTWTSRQSSGTIRDREYGHIFHGTRIGGSGMVAAGAGRARCMRCLPDWVAWSQPASHGPHPPGVVAVDLLAMVKFGLLAPISASNAWFRNLVQVSLPLL